MKYNELNKNCNIQNCIKYYNQEKKLVFEEKNKKYIAHNNSQKKVLGFLIDNGLIKDHTTKKCDCCIIVEEDICYLIELKGNHLEDACEQLSKTIDIFKNNYSIQKFICRVVLSRTNTHEIEPLECKNLRKKIFNLMNNATNITNIKKEYLLKYKTKKFEEKI